MLTKRKKERILFSAVGFFFGVCLSVVIAYFGVVKHFAKENIEKAQDMFTKEIEKAPIEKNDEKITIVPQKISVEKKDGLESQQNSDVQQEENQEEIIIQGDEFIQSAKIAVFRTGVDIIDHTEIVQNMEVEQWKSPMNFIGYKLTKDKLIVYGVPIEEIELFQDKDNLYLALGENIITLDYSEDFLHFPVSFFKNKIDE